jgi:hypothetical protein
MKILAFCLLLSTAAFATPVHVRSTVTKKGEYRQSHVRTSPNHTQRDNYSSKPNTNPYTGKKGTRNPKR